MLDSTVKDETQRKLDGALGDTSAAFRNAQKFTHEWDRRQPTTCFTEIRKGRKEKKASLQSHAAPPFPLPKHRTHDKLLTDA